jgi:hypothetical protein
MSFLSTNRKQHVCADFSVADRRTQPCSANPLKKTPRSNVADGAGEFFDPPRKFWRGKLMIKGIDTHEDARLALDHGFDGILVFQKCPLPLQLRYE